MSRTEMAGCDLGGRGVLVTRPAAQADALCALIAEAGGRPIRLPTIEIVPPVDAAPARALLTADWDLLYFVSVNAVEQALALVPAAEWPRGARIAAVGRATAEALAAAGLVVDLMPRDSYDSETLLRHPALAEMSGQRVLIVRGDGGRAVFANALRERGAEVAFAEVYRRVCPAHEVAPLLGDWEARVGLALATSNRVLDNLVGLIGPAGRAQLLATPLAVIAERTARHAEEIGFARVEVADRADDPGMLAALCRLCAEH
ncbi:uroporphyrinogen-III synthase [Marichromatium bheemlicum]